MRTERDLERIRIFAKDHEILRCRHKVVANLQQFFVCSRRAIAVRLHCSIALLQRVPAPVLRPLYGLLNVLPNTMQMISPLRVITQQL
jgi:hypothetical protein